LDQETIAFLRKATRAMSENLLPILLGKLKDGQAIDEVELFHEGWFVAACHLYVTEDPKLATASFDLLLKHVGLVREYYEAQHLEEAAHV
jgi:hypothetical protein